MYTIINYRHCHNIWGEIAARNGNMDGIMLLAYHKSRNDEDNAIRFVPPLSHLFYQSLVHFLYHFLIPRWQTWNISSWKNRTSLYHMVDIMCWCTDDARVQRISSLDIGLVRRKIPVSAPESLMRPRFCLMSTFEGKRLDDMVIIDGHQEPLLLTRFNFNPGMDK